MRANEIREMTDDELEQRLRERRNDLISFRMQMATGVVDDVRAARMTRREIARIKTIQRERQVALAEERQREAT